MWKFSVATKAIVCVALSIVSVTAFKDEMPEPSDFAKTARLLVHQSNWTAISTISTIPEINGYPMVNVRSIADSAAGAKSTGHIYLMLTEIGITDRLI